MRLHTAASLSANTSFITHFGDLVTHHTSNFRVIVSCDIKCI